mmetsp:Transcript_19195/g.35080  ORF Transcript_19195/g.35080 Transcript_19195/m.35080 type:complete len:457 (-) Transcript_19195:511-1881(-)|eukprot:CAMPEP_0204898140 /NCGR_PEP_ID=MMETSP1397-20131031/1116_1 /ASSEMBLY_ACC=CAM_ASM_000891 /TAXON_ID=49980 /ORGANISM="Climacostomum Climacostomum virens, Strain Stock W-24" /LENGTH=456 /DNA_ID=CAMNT_0052065943 /DNA_START=209 /DNA_END=1579 /DNA_ORIENTATION=+
MLAPSSGTEVMELHKACRIGDLDAIKLAYRAKPESLHERDENLGWSPLYRTVICGHVAASRFLLEMKADPNLSNKLGETPLHQVADNSQYTLAELLLEFHADPNARQNEGDTPLHHASFRGDVKMVQLLLKSGANPNVANYIFKRTPLHYAADCNNIDCVKVLLSYGADPLLVDCQGKTAASLSSDSEMRQLITEFRGGDEILSLSPDTGFSPFTAQEEFTGNSELAQTFHKPKHLPDFAPIVCEEPKEPDAEVSVVKRKDLGQLYDWLERHNLAEIYELLVEAGFDDLDAMIRQMHSPLPINLETLKSIGVTKPGHCMRLLLKLEEAAVQRPKVLQKTPVKGKAPWTCCAAPRHTTYAITTHASICDWLQGIHLEILSTNFIEAGYSEHELLLSHYTSTKYPLTDEFLEHDIKVSKPGHRKRILAKLAEEAESQKEGCEIETTANRTACGLCRVM